MTTADLHDVPDQRVPPTLPEAVTQLLDTGDEVLRFMGATDPLNIALRDVFMVRLDRARQALALHNVEVNSGGQDNGG